MTLRGRDLIPVSQFSGAMGVASWLGLGVAVGLGHKTASNERAFTHEEWPSQRVTTQHSSNDQTVTKSSSPPVATYFPSGLQQTQSNPPKWLRILPWNSSFCTLYTRMKPSWHASAMKMPSGEKAIALTAPWLTFQRWTRCPFENSFTLASCISFVVWDEEELAPCSTFQK